MTAYNRAVGSLEARLLVSARRLSELGVSDDSLPTPAQLEVAARQPQAPELLPCDGSGNTMHGRRYPPT